MSVIDNDWLPVLSGEFSKEYYKRLFYSLKKDGRNYFSDDSPIKYFEAYNPIDNNFNGRFESINKIVYLIGILKLFWKM